MLSRAISLWQTKLGKVGYSGAAWGIFWFLLDLPGRVQTIRDWLPRLSPGARTALVTLFSQNSAVIVFACGIALLLIELGRMPTKSVTATVSASNADSPPPIPPRQERLFVDATPDYLCGLFNREHTNVQASALLAPYLGKWKRVRGFVRDVVPDVGLWGKQTYTVLAETKKSDTLTVWLALRFDAGWNDQLTTLRRGDTVAAIGKIVNADSGILRLENCELVPVPDEPDEPPPEETKKPNARRRRSRIEND